jgi:signal peptidase II
VSVSTKTRAYWLVVAAVLLADWASKRAAVAALSPPGHPHRLLGNVLRLTLSYNRGAAMGIPLGSHVSGALGVLGLVVAVVLWIWYRRTPDDRAWIGATLGLLTGGALGNAWERLLAPLGVVDFIDVGVGTHRFWTFNVADSALTVGVVLLVLLLETEEHPPPAPDTPDGTEREDPPTPPPSAYS